MEENSYNIKSGKLMQNVWQNKRKQRDGLNIAGQRSGKIYLCVFDREINYR